VGDCEECLRLWNAHAAATHNFFRLRSKDHIADLTHDQDQRLELIPQLRDAEQQRTHSRSALNRHKAEAHGGSLISDGVNPTGGQPIPTSEQESWRAVDQARGEFLQAVSEQSVVFDDVRSGLCGTDGRLRLETTGRQLREKYQRYQNAVAALQEFLESNRTS
jgi:hypothetical protein